MRLSATTAGRLPDSVARADYDRNAQRSGIVHLGIGAFHRAHQAVYTDAAMAAGDRDWAITGVSLRSAAVQDQLRPQDGLYTVTERSLAGDRVRLIQAVTTVLVAPHQADAVRQALAAPETQIVTLTVTEKGYHRRPDGSLDNAALAATCGTIYHHLAQAVHDRHDRGLGPLTLLSCDNLTGNGHVLRSALAAHLDHGPSAYRRWFEDSWACPSSMVDRIVPATTAADRGRLAAYLGMEDAAAVMTEPFHQWVIEDRFATPRPRWQLAGAQFVDDVRPYETAKLRMLNGAHSGMAYLGLARGHDFVHQAIADEGIRTVVESLMLRDAVNSLSPSADIDLTAYADVLLKRFTNPALRHRLLQIAADGSQKIGPRWLEPLRENRARGLSSPAYTTMIAAWLFFVYTRRDIDDPMRDEILAARINSNNQEIIFRFFGRNGLMVGPRHLAEDDLISIQHQLFAIFGFN